MPDPHTTLSHAEELLERVRARTSPTAIKNQKRRIGRFFRRMKIAFFTNLGVMLTAALIGTFVTPLGIGGFFLTLILMVIIGSVILFWPSAAAPTPAALAKSDLPALPHQTSQWLEKQRPALPAPAQILADSIGLKLEALAPQLQPLDAATPAAIEIRKLISVELPELIEGYRRVPEQLRRESRNGMSPDRQLADGLAVVDSEIARMTEQLASGDLDRLATQRRYLELKYRGDESGS